MRRGEDKATSVECHAFDKLVCGTLYIVRRTVGQNVLCVNPTHEGGVCAVGISTGGKQKKPDRGFQASLKADELLGIYRFLRGKESKMDRFTVKPVYQDAPIPSVPGTHRSGRLRRF